MHPALKIPIGKRLFITGRTGSGKTAGLVFLLRMQEIPVIVLDTKIEDKFLQLPNATVVNGIENFDNVDFSEFDYQPFIVVRPTPEENEPEICDDFLMQLHRGCKNVCIAIDELYNVHISGSHGPGLRALLTQGRSKGQSVLMGAQRPSWISLFCLSESDYYMIYALNLLKDRRRLYEMIGQDVVLKKLDPYRFLWYTVARDELLGFTPVPLAVPNPTREPEPSVEKFFFV